MLGGGSDPQPLPLCHSSFPAPGALQLGLTQQGQEGAVGGSFQLHLCLGKIPFHVAACDLSRRLCRMGRPAGSRGRCCSRGHPHPLHKANLQHLRTSRGQRGSSLGVRGWKPGQLGAPRQEAPACPHLVAGNTQAADGLGQPLLACLQVWGGRLRCQPQGGVRRDSASLYLVMCQLAAQP